jgi:hypothetical protein
MYSISVTYIHLSKDPFEHRGWAMTELFMVLSASKQMSGYCDEGGHGHVLHNSHPIIYHIPPFLFAASYTAS